MLSQMPFVAWSGLARKPDTRPVCKGGDDLAAMLGCQFMHLAGGSFGLQEREERYLSGINPSDAALPKSPLVCLSKWSRWRRAVTAGEAGAQVGSGRSMELQVIFGGQGENCPCFFLWHHMSGFKFAEHEQRVSYSTLASIG